MINGICLKTLLVYGKPLEDDIIDDTSGSFKRLMYSLCSANRDESFDVNSEAAREDARQLLQAGTLVLILLLFKGIFHFNSKIIFQRKF